MPKEKLDTFAQKGGIEFKDVVLRYRPNLPTVLNKLSFKINAGEKVGIVGRTAAGKSTMSLALTRIVEIEAGRINIDGDDIQETTLDNLRDRVTVIPQDPTLFTGTLRFNIDPRSLHSDEKILALLNEAGLDKLLEKESSSTEKKGEKEEQGDKTGPSDETKKKDDKKAKNALDMEITERGSNLSSGEKSLICICRAILRQNKVIILDEATANIDLQTEIKIQDLITKCFKDCTVLTIAHRL